MIYIYIYVDQDVSSFWWNTFYCLLSSSGLLQCRWSILLSLLPIKILQLVKHEVAFTMKRHCCSVSIYNAQQRPCLHSSDQPYISQRRWSGMAIQLRVTWNVVCKATSLCTVLLSGKNDRNEVYLILMGHIKASRNDGDEERQSRLQVSEKQTYLWHKSTTKWWAAGLAALQNLMRVWLC